MRFLRLSSLYFISTLSAIKAARKNHIFCIFFLLIPCRERIQSVNRPFALVDHVLTQILLIFGGRCNHYFWDMRLKIHRLLNFNMLFQFLLKKKFPQAKYFRVYRKLVTWPTIAKGLSQDWKVNASNGLYSTLKSFSILEPTLSFRWTPLGPSLLYERCPLRLTETRKLEEHRWGP